jgi:hypothetical protein
LRRRLSREEREWLNALHRQADGRYRVGASPFYIRKHPEGDWGVYSDSLEGEVRIRGAWVFKRLRDARSRAFAVAKQLGYA